MSIFSDHHLQFVGNETHFLSSAGESRTLQPADFFDILAETVGGKITITVESLDFHKPSYVRVIGPRPNPADLDEEGPGSVQTWYNCVEVRVELFRAEEAVKPPLKTPGGKQREGYQEMVFEWDAGPIQWQQTRWRLRVTNTSQKVVAVVGGMRFVRDRDFIGETRVPLRVLNHSFGVVLNGLAPHAKISGNTLRFGFGEELAQTLGLQGNHPLREQTIPIDLPADATGELKSIELEVVPGSDVLEAVFKRWSKIENQINAALPVAEHQHRGFLLKWKEKNDAWRAEWEAKVEPNLVAVHVTALIMDIDLELDIIPGFEFDLGTIKDATVHLYLAFERIVSGQSGHALFFTSANYEGAIEALAYLGLVPHKRAEKIFNGLQPEIRKHIGLLHRYFAEVLGRISPFLGDVSPIFIDATADEKSVLVRYTSDPAARRNTIPPKEDERPDNGPTVPRRPRHFEGIRPDRGRPIVADPTGTGEPVHTGQRGAVPEGFYLGDPASVDRLDKIDTIVVVMMENRSFDHLLGNLRKVRGPGPGYTCFPDDASNTYEENGFQKRVKMVPATDAVRPPVTQIWIDPHHGFEHVKEQVADGAMSGFAADFPEAAQIPLTYYEEAQIPNYYRLADQFMVCDQWYCAHPGPTYPNRWATLTGTLLQVNNLHVDDKRLGFLRERTIFDLLKNEGIAWNYYENNVSMIRMYSNYRLDDQNVLPFNDPLEGFEAKAAAGTLPPVVFVEPRFTGIPPLQQTSDDHPPSDLVVGQQFITRVYNALADSPQWERSLLVITYDEHGGFYDHVPPPGTRLGPQEWVGKVPRIHPEGADFMGPRVPTFVISPFVDAGSVTHAVFDHTSIIKTILVRHRKKFLAHQLGWFGPRVMMINHLGVALNRNEARPGKPDLLPAPPLRQRPQLRQSPQPEGSPRQRPTELHSQEDLTDFHVSLARAMLPKPG